MAESSWPTTAGGRAINDVQWEMMARGFAADGVIGAPTETSVVYGDSSGMQVKIRANKDALVRGRGWTSGSVEFTKAIAANNSGNPRIDLIVLRLTRSTWAVTVEVRQGTAAASPVAPTLTQDATGSGAGVYEIALAQVTVANGASTIASGNVANVARYIGPNYSGGRAKLMHWNPASATNWNITTGPNADAQGTSGNVPALRQTFDKQSPDTNLEIDMTMSGYTSGAGKVTCGVRIIGSGYTSTNFTVGWHYYNYPVYVGVDYSAYLSTDKSDARHWHNIGQHNHGVPLPSFHQNWKAMLHVPDLGPRTYTVQAFIFTSGITFTADANDRLSMRVAEV